MKKSKVNPPEGYSACYRYRYSNGSQLLAIKYADDVAAIDLLLSKDMQRQARLIANQPINRVIK